MQPGRGRSGTTRSAVCSHGTRAAKEIFDFAIAENAAVIERMTTGHPDDLERCWAVREGTRSRGCQALRE